MARMGKAFFLSAWNCEAAGYGHSCEVNFNDTVGYGGNKTVVGTRLLWAEAGGFSSLFGALQD